MRTNSSSGYHFSEQFACEAKLRPLRHRCALRPPGQQCLKRYLRCRPGLHGSPGRDISLRLGSSRSPLQFGPSSGIFWAKVCKHIKSRLYDTQRFIYSILDIPGMDQCAPQRDPQIWTFLQCLIICLPLGCVFRIDAHCDARGRDRKCWASWLVRIFY